MTALFCSRHQTGWDSPPVLCPVCQDAVNAGGRAAHQDFTPQEAMDCHSSSDDTPRINYAGSCGTSALTVEAKKLERECARWKHAFEVVKARDEDALAADRAVERALGREEAIAARTVPGIPRAEHPDTVRLRWLLDDYRRVDLHNAIGTMSYDFETCREHIDNEMARGVSAENIAYSPSWLCKCGGEIAGRLTRCCFCNRPRVACDVPLKGDR